MPELSQSTFGPSGEVPAELLERLCHAVGAEPEPARAPDSASTDPRPWQASLEDACRPLGLRIEQVWLSPREALGAASRRFPLVCWRAEDGGGTWVLLLDRVRGRARLAAPGQPDRWVDVGGLTQHLGAGHPGELLPWCLAVPSLLPEFGAGAREASGGGRLPPSRRLFALLRPERADLWSIVVFALLVGGLTLATPIAVQLLVNTVAFGGLIQPVVVLALLLFGGLAFSATLFALQAYVAERIQRRVFVRVAVDLAERLPRVLSDVFEQRHGPELVNRFFDVVTIQKVGAILLVDGTAVLLQTLVGLIVLSFYHPAMLAFSAVLIGAIALVVFVLGRGAVSTAVRESKAKYAMAGWLEELARHPAAFRGSGARSYALGRADALAHDYVSARGGHYRIVFRQLSGALALQVIASAGLLALGGGLVVAGQLTLGQLVASELIVTAIVAAFAKLGKQLESFYDLLAAVDKLGELFDLPLERTEGGEPPTLDGPASVEIRDVTLSGGSRQLLSHLDLKVRAGERVALVGPSGSGKSSLLELLSGLRSPDEGYVLLDGQDIREIRLDLLRDQVAIVAESEIFSGSVLDNVRVGRPEVSVGDVDWALESVGLLHEVRALPEGHRTRLSTDGAPLSQGQIARLMLARAVAGRPRLLLLDHALVTLDEVMRRRVSAALLAEDAPWTLVLVSSWPDVVGCCGRVVELGGPKPRPLDEAPIRALR